MQGRRKKKKHDTPLKWCVPQCVRKRKKREKNIESETEWKEAQFERDGRICFYFIKISCMFAIRCWLRCVSYLLVFFRIFPYYFRWFSFFVFWMPYVSSTSFCVSGDAMNPGHPSTNKKINSFETWIRFRNTDNFCMLFLCQLLRLVECECEWGKKKRNESIYICLCRFVLLFISQAKCSIYLHIQYLRASLIFIRRLTMVFAFFFFASFLLSYFRVTYSFQSLPSFLLTKFSSSTMWRAQFYQFSRRITKYKLFYLRNESKWKPKRKKKQQTNIYREANGKYLVRNTKNTAALHVFI